MGSAIGVHYATAPESITWNCNCSTRPARRPASATSSSTIPEFVEYDATRNQGLRAALTKYTVVWAARLLLGSEQLPTVKYLFFRCRIGGAPSWAGACEPAWDRLAIPVKIQDRLRGCRKNPSMESGFRSVRYRPLENQNVEDVRACPRHLASSCARVGCDLERLASRLGASPAFSRRSTLTFGTVN